MPLTRITTDNIDFSANLVFTNVNSIEAKTVVANSVSVGNSTVNASINSTVFSGAANNASYLNGNTAGDLQTYADNKAANAYSNAASYTDTKAGTSYSNAVLYADTVSGTAYSNAIAYAASNTYVNSTFAKLSGATFTGNVITQANLTTNSIFVNGSVQIDGNLIVGGNVVTINTETLEVQDNMIYLNANSGTANPDLGIAGNYNDGTYRHAGFFRDASDGVWKVFDQYLPEPDASPYIDTTNNTFRLATFQAGEIYVGNTSVYATINTTNFNGTSNNALYLNGNSANDLRTYTDNKAANAYSNAISYSGNAALAYANAVLYVDGKSFVNSSQLSSNLANYQTTSGLSANVATLTSNNTLYLGGTAAASYVQNADSRTLSGNLNFTGSNTYFSAPVTHAANIIITPTSGISANGSYGTNGQILTTNGTSVYWTTSSGVNTGKAIAMAMIFGG